MGYSFRKLNENDYLIQGDKKESMYLLIGEEKALVIDAGMEEESLLQFVRTLTDKPLVMALTHGHFDHIGQTGEFDEVYISPKDLDMFREHSERPMGMQIKLNTKPAEDLLMLPESFDLGGISVIPVALEGHTPGSYLFADMKNQCVFSGDAVGSGCGVLMLIGGASDMKTYKAGILDAISQMEKLGVDDSWAFFGGHDGQEKLSKVSEYNPVCLQLVKDMAELCQKLMDGTAEYEKKEVRIPRMNVTPLHAWYGKAEMDLSQEQI